MTAAGTKLAWCRKSAPPDFLDTAIPTLAIAARQALLRAPGRRALSLGAALIATFLSIGCGAQVGQPSVPRAEQSGNESPQSASRPGGTEGPGPTAKDQPPQGIRHEAPPVLAVTPRQGNRNPGPADPDEIDAPAVNNPVIDPVISPTVDPVIDPTANPGSGPDRIALDFHVATGEPLANIDLQSRELETKDVPWHGVFFAKSGEKDDTDLWRRFAPFFLRHVIVYGNGKASEVRASKWVSEFIDQGELVSLLASKKNDKKRGKEFEAELAALIAEREAVLTPAPFEDDESLSGVSLSNFDALLTRWTHAEFARLPTEDVYFDARPRADDDGILGAFITHASAFLPSGRFVPLTWAHTEGERGQENKEVTVAGLLREGVLHAIVRNDSSLCRPLEAHLALGQNVKDSEVLRLVPSLGAAPAVVVPYIAGMDCVPQKGVLLIRARL